MIGKITAVLHELSHVYLEEKIKSGDLFTEAAEECLVNGLETALHNYLLAPSRAELLASWNRAIERKLSS